MFDLDLDLTLDTGRLKRTLTNTHRMCERKQRCGEQQTFYTRARCTASI